MPSESDEVPADSRPVFIHINKNAGTSIAGAVGNAVRLAGHQTAEQWVTQHGGGSRLFAVIRNPFDRVLSEYHYRRRRFRSGEQNRHLANLHLPFDAWVRATFRDGEFRTRAFFEASGVPFVKSRMIDDCLVWFVPQTRWIDSADGERLVGDLLRYERLEQDWSAFVAARGIDAELGHRNSSRRTPESWQSYTAEAQSIVRDHYRDDFVTFGYDDELPGAR